jgi:hypothetical protein
VPIEYLYRGDLNCLFLRYRGELKASDLSAVIDRVVADTTVPPRHLRLSDLRSITAGPDAEIVQKMAQRADAGERQKSAIRAAILGGSDLQYGMARLYQAYRENGQEEISIFKTYAEALKWLELPADTPDIFAIEDGWK